MEHTLHRVMCRYFCIKVFFFTLSMENVVFSNESEGFRLSLLCLKRKHCKLRSMNFNDNYLNRMKEISLVLLVQVVLYKGDCSF